MSAEVYLRYVVMASLEVELGLASRSPVNQVPIRGQFRDLPSVEVV
jgi:hypothetical protein